MIVLGRFRLECSACANFQYIHNIHLVRRNQSQREHYPFLAFAAAIARVVSRYVLESVNSSVCLIFRLPSSSVTMCPMKIDSRMSWTPIEVLAMFVSCWGWVLDVRSVRY